MIRTTLIMDEETRNILKELSELHGSQTAAVKHSLEEAYRNAQQSKDREAYIEWLAAEGFTPSGDDEQWAKRIAMETAALKESFK